MAKKKSIRVDFIKSCITYNKLNKIAISGIENICKRLNLDSIYDVINGRFAIPSKRPSGKKSSSKRVLFFLFFSILNIQNETKSQGFSGCRALALPLGEPHPFRVSLNGMGCITYGKPGKMCIYIPTHMRER